MIKTATGERCDKRLFCFRISGSNRSRFPRGETMGQLNKELGANTVQFHTAYPLPDLECTTAGRGVPSPA